ncbi:chemotaxis protein CheA [Arcobacter sp.]|uniref:chemotaxis protein CheA n=1 Tax=Arcobacter sp. TaxID=1872629 RepID=UPI003D0A2728
MNDFAGIASAFRDESIDLLERMESSLVDIREGNIDDESINSIFRAAHTIKGTAGMYHLDYIVSFTHVAENLLDDVRNEKIELTSEIIELLFECKDYMEELVLFAFDNQNGELPPKEMNEVAEELIKRLSTYLTAEAVSDIQKVDNSESSNNSMNEWKITIAYHLEMYEQGFDPYNFIRFLSTRGEILFNKTDLSKIPSLKNIDPTKCYLHSEIIYKTTMNKDEILDVFEFIEEDSTIKVESLEVPSIEEETSNENVIKKLTQSKKDSKLINSSNTIRVDAEKIDTLINLIGELVIANANVVQKATERADTDLLESLSIASRMLEDIRESAMQIRMVEIGDTFNKFKRIVQDIAKKVDKEVELSINGGDTELDKTVVEKISDPLVHIVRNAVDHGLETASERSIKGKNPTGLLKLNAYHDAGTIVISIEDDGKGLNEEVILKKALEKGLIEEGVNLSQNEIFNLILLPGFSTASAVTDLSGRGVGMDVVKRNIESLRGNIEIQSKKDEGTKFIIRLPLTLAIIDGFLTRTGNTYYAIPLEMVVECIELSDRYKEETTNNKFINLRGELLPLLNLRDFFGEAPKRVERENIVVTQYAGQKFGIIVDELMGELQTAIKPLGKIFNGLKGLSGVSILGSGSVSLILDIPMLINHIQALHRIEHGGSG